jgi:uncharacterized protein
MSRQEENVAVVREGFEAFARGGIDAVVPTLDSEIEVHTPAEMANTGTYYGHEAYLAWMERWVESWEDYEVEVVNIEPIGERHVIVEIHQRARGTGSGVEVEMRNANMFEIRAGKVVRFHVYPGRQQAIAEAEAGEQG